jgi:viologen exporter family transport system permease protein
VAESFAVYCRLAGANIRAQLQYRVSFVIDLTATFLLSFLDFLAVLILFHNVPRLAGWSVHEVAFLYGSSAIAFALAELLVGHSEQLAMRLRTGTFDVLLARPRGTLYQVAASELPLRRLGRVLQGLVVFVYALAGVNIDWTFGRVAMLFAMVPTGVLLFASMWVVALCLLFWTVDGNEFSNAFTYGGQTMTQYPIDIYGQWLRRFLAYLVPTAFVCYFPSLYLLGKNDPLGLPRIVQFIAPLVALASAAVAGLAWRTAVRHYRGAGG